MPTAESVCPAGISSFFQICTVDSNGNPLEDAARIGARGGGFGIKRGVKARVTVRRAQTRISIRINSNTAPQARTTRWAITQFLKERGREFDVTVDLKIRVPIGAGFGTSAAGTLAACLALADAADIPTTLNDLGRLTHVADVLNSTGLGTASALVHGGFVLVTEPGAPGIGMVDQLLFPSDYVVVCAYLGSIPKREALSEMNLAPRVNPAGGAVLEAVRKRPNLQTFLRECRTFDSTIGFETPGVSQLIETMVSAGAVGAVQNMLGEAVHGVIAKTRAERAVKKIQAAFPTAKVFASELDNLGVRLV